MFQVASRDFGFDMGLGITSISRLNFVLGFGVGFRVSLGV